MVVNTESVVGYNNNLRTADPTQGVKLGVNNGVNQGTKKAALAPMAGGPSKVNPPNSHPANPIHKQAVQAQELAPAKALFYLFIYLFKHGKIHQELKKKKKKKKLKIT